MKEYILIELLTKCGEYEFTSYLRRVIDKDRVWSIGTYEAAHFYEDFTYQDGDWFYYNGGEVATKLVKTTLLTKEEYDFLNKVM